MKLRLSKSDTSTITWTSLFVDDFQKSYGSLNSDSAERILKKSTLQLAWRFVLDFGLCHVLFGPAIIAYWRGSWDYFFLSVDSYFEECTTPNLICLFAGFLSCLLLQAYRFELRDNIAGRFGSLRHSFVAGAYALLIGFLDVCYWKGLWDIVDCSFGKKLSVAWVTAPVGMVTLVMAGAGRTAISPPSGVFIDTDSNSMEVQTYFGLDNRSPKLHIIGDVAFSLILEAALILLWHGTWTMQDIYTEHLTSELSAWISMVFSRTELFLAIKFPFAIFYPWVIGLLAGALVFVLQFYIAYLDKEDRINLPWKWAVNAGYSTIGGIGAVSSYRGVWFLLDEYYMPANYEISLLHGQIIGGLLLLLCNCGCSLYPGVMVDRPGPKDGSLVDYYYLTYYYFKETNDKIRNASEEKALNS